MILVLDLDDTLLRADKSVSAGSTAALQRWFAGGHEVVVATGRPPRSVEEVLPEALLGVTRIVYNGAQVVEHGQVTYRNEIAPDDVRTIVEWAESCMPHWCVGLEIEDRLYLNRATHKRGSYEVAELQRLCDRPAAKIIFLFPDGREDVAPLLAALPATTRALITPKFSLVQVCGHKTDKATALSHVLAGRGLEFADVAAIGDDINDVEMVACAGVGIAVDNALPEVKAVADWITLSNEADGVAAAIDRLLGGQNT
jgi:Cof subfamily protein (haloacid dehalogenase superfamily)